MKNIDLYCFKNLASAWNQLDISLIKNNLAEDVTYISQWVFLPIVGKIQVLNYLDQKFNSIKLAKTQGIMYVTAEMATHPSLRTENCIILTQVTGEEVRQVLIEVHVKSHKISSIDICFLPNPEDAIVNDDDTL